MARSKWKWTSIATVPDLCPTTVKILIHLFSRYQLPLRLREAATGHVVSPYLAWRSCSAASYCQLELRWCNINSGSRNAYITKLNCFPFIISPILSIIIKNMQKQIKSLLTFIFYHRAVVKQNQYMIWHVYELFKHPFWDAAMAKLQYFCMCKCALCINYTSTYMHVLFLQLSPA